MSRSRAFRILVATDGSSTANAALAAAAVFPWPAASLASAVVASPVDGGIGSTKLVAALDRSRGAIAAAAADRLKARWRDADVRVVDAPPVEAIVEEASRRRADVIVMGWRGHGPVRRLLTGSVSRGVVRRAGCAVLVVRRPPARIRHVVIGFDGSPLAERAIGLIAALAPPADGRVTLFTAVGTIAPSLPGLLPTHTRSALAVELRRINRSRVADARWAQVRAARDLTDAGWRVDHAVSAGAPLRGLLALVDSTRPDLVAVGARGVSGLRHLLLGSVAEGTLDRSPVAVLLAR